jgi:anthranilate phosphoribosyltransferase
VLDVCGTGGDSKGTFNISTTVAFVLAGAGYKVAKHGNYGVSSGCGSSDVLEALGVRFTTDPARLLRSLEYAGVCFLHAPSFHPALRAAAPVRRELGVRTVFNMLGPLVNPARPAFQMNGVYDREVLRLYGYLLKRRGAKFAVLHSLDGCDEVSLAAPTEVIWHTGRCVIHAEDFKLPTVKPAELRAPGSQQGSAALLRAVLTNDGPPAHQAVVLANAAVAIWCHNGSSNTKQLPECVEIAREALTSGAAAEALRRSIENTNAE